MSFTTPHDQPFLPTMNGREFLVELERRGFAVKRRSRTFVWIGRGEQTLMLDEDATVPDKILRQLLERSLTPPSMRCSRPPPSGRTRISKRP